MVAQLSSHAIDLRRFMTSDTIAVSAALRSEVSREMTADDGHDVLFRLADGAQGVLSGSCRAWDMWDMSRLRFGHGTVAFAGQQV